MEYTYDKTGNITQSKDYAGTVTEYVYDDMDRMVKKTVGTETTTFTYDKTGQLVKVTDGSGDISYRYDKYGRLTKQTDVKGNTLSYTYDKAGRLETFDNGFGKTAYEYDLLDRVTKVLDRNGKITLYEYDELGNRSAVRYPNGNVATYTYDACQRLKEECVTNGNGVQLSRYSYGIGRAGERTSITEVYSGVGTEITYKYDKLNRLVKETTERDKNKLTCEYSYDKVSNRTEKTVSVKGDISALADVDLEDVQVTEGTTTYTYNALNQLITETSLEGNIIYTYDANGNLVKQTGNKTVDYTYDKENHLTKAAVRQGNSVIIEDYTYDYAGNRTSKTVNGKDPTFYVNDTRGSLTMVAAETDKDGKETAYYTRGEELLSMERNGEVCYYLYDGHESVRMLTNEAGRITDRYSYDAYGNLLEKEGDTENEFLYTGEQYNANTGLYYLRARYMNPSTGTFISMDSYQGSIYDPVSLHKYLYANANPVMYTDPSGYFLLAGLATCTTASQILSASWKFITFNTIMGALTGAAFGAVDSILGGNDFSKVVQDSLKGAFSGAVLGCVISALTCFSVLYPQLLVGLQIFRYGCLAYSGVGVFISIEEENPAQAIFRVLMGILAYVGLGKTIEGVKLINAGGNGGVPEGYYQDANGRWHRPNGQFASNAEVGISNKTSGSNRVHGNSLSNPNENYGYVLVDKNTGEIPKFGETLYPDTRYSQNYLDSINAEMRILDSGSKLDIHLWQHDLIMYYFYKYNEFPLLNKGGW